MASKRDPFLILEDDPIVLGDTWDEPPVRALGIRPWPSPVPEDEGHLGFRSLLDMPSSGWRAQAVGHTAGARAGR